MKRFISVFLVLILMLSLCACTTSTREQDSDKLRIIATIFPQFDFARQIAGDSAQVSMLVSPGAETHSFEPTTSDIIDISNCDIFIYTGGESDSWIDGILENVNNPNMTIISLMDCIGADSASNAHSDHAHDHGTADEHVWTSPLNCITISEHITEVMCEKDEKNADTYRANLKAYTESLSGLDRSFRGVVDSAKRNTLVFGDRFPLKYFAEEYDLECYAAFTGCSDDTEASASTIASLIDKVKEDNIPVVLKIELSSDATAKTICNETGAEMMTYYSCHNISKDDFDSGATYLSLMEKNVETLKIALN